MSENEADERRYPLTVVPILQENSPNLAAVDNRPETWAHLAPTARPARAEGNQPLAAIERAIGRGNRGREATDELRRLATLPETLQTELARRARWGT